MNDFKILVSTVFAAFMAFMPAVAQDKIITKDGDVLQGWNVEVSDKYVFYNTENKTDADIKRMEKDKVLMVKRQDGSTLNLYEDAQPAAKQAPAAAEPAGEGPVMVKVEDLTENSRKENDALLSSINAEPSFVLDNEEDLKKKAQTVTYVLGVKNNSVLTDGNVRLRIVTGTLYKANKAAPAVFKESFAETQINPALSIHVENLSDRTIYVDLGNSFFVRMGQSFCYYIPSSTTSSSSSSSGAGVNLGSVAGALGVGGVVGQLAGGVNIGGGSTNGGSTTTYAQRVISVPPKTKIALDAQYVFGNENRTVCPGLRYRGRSGVPYDRWPIFRFPKKSAAGPLMNGEHCKYSEESSPFNVAAMIAYSFNENCSNERILYANIYLKNLFGVSFNPWKMKLRGTVDIAKGTMAFIYGDIDDSDGVEFPRK